VETHNQLANPMDGVFYNPLNEDSEPETIELRHVIKECCEKAHELAYLCLYRFVW